MKRTRKPSGTQSTMKRIRIAFNEWHNLMALLIGHVFHYSIGKKTITVEADRDLLTSLGY